MNQNGILKNVQVKLVKHKNKGKKQKQQTEIKNLNIRLQHHQPIVPNQYL